MKVNQSVLSIPEIRAELQDSPKLMTYLKAGRALKNIGGTLRRVRIVSSFTARGLEPYLRVEAALSNWAIEPAFYEYGLWQQALLDDPVDPAPDAYVLLLHAEEFSPVSRSMLSTLEATKTGIVSLLRSFRTRTDTPIIIPALPEQRAISALGFGLGGRLPSARFAHEVNACLRDLAASVPGIYVVELPPAVEIYPDGMDQAALYTTMSPISSKHAAQFSEMIVRALSGFFRPRKKVLVTDLDNTIWGGVVGEAGAACVAIGPEWPGQAHKLLQRAMLDLSETGILLAINSKNNEADAREVFETRSDMVLQWGDFVARRINWTDKADNILSIAKELSLGIDSFVFIDDSPVECARVREALPAVDVIQLPENPAHYVQALLDCRGFDTLTVSAEDRNRVESYKAEGKRREALENVGMELSDFLASLELSICIQTLSDQDAAQSLFDRVHQLFQKTNQFHLTLDRLTPGKIGARRANLYAVSLTDKFGDYGVIGAFEVVHGQQSLMLSNFLLSCRALGRRVEETIIGFLAEKARHYELDSVSAVFRKGPRNQPALTFLQDFGFEERNGDPGTDKKTFDLAISAETPCYPKHVKINTPGCVNTAKKE
ncbi:MAG: HAD-IIIC family phosphatase [Alphaproteobacteria bacterium]|nr:HAD-IIIC family phosphatase [Alphaproteobacteria bacterium]